MKIIALGDTHGRSYWKAVARSQEFDKLLLLGDYFDSFNISATQQINNFLEIIAYKRSNPTKVVLLTGNHDLHYLPAAMGTNEIYTGFQDRYAFRIGHLLQEHKDQMQACCKLDQYLFTHAGVTETWLKNSGYKGEAIDVFINELFRHRPGKFFFTGSDPYGDDVTQSPFWVRPASLQKNAYDYENVKQVVGHTSVQQLQIVKDRYFFIDTLESSGEYLIIEDGKVSIDKVR